MTTLTQFTNNASSTLASAITTSATSIPLATGTGALFPVLSGSKFFYGTLASSSTTATEIVQVTATSTDTMTVVRAQGGTTATAFASGDKFELRITAASATNWENKADLSGATFTAPIFADTNVKIGMGGGAISTNTAVGTNALNVNTTGAYNTALGVYALTANTTGSANTAVGVNALNQNTSGSSNVAVGDNALLSDTGSYNTSIGVSSLYNATSGGSNTVVGNTSFYDVTTGQNNTAIGQNTGRGITTGSGNTILGSSVTGLAAGLSSNVIVANGNGTIQAQHDGTNWTLQGTVAVSAATAVGQAVNLGQLNTSLRVAKAWVNFDGTTAPPTIKSSFNVGSITKNGTGDYTINFSNAMTDVNYAPVATVSGSGSGGTYLIVQRYSGTAQTTTSVRFVVPGVGTSNVDTSEFTAVIFGN